MKWCRSAQKAIPSAKLSAKFAMSTFYWKQMNDKYLDRSNDQAKYLKPLNSIPDLHHSLESFFDTTSVAGPFLNCGRMLISYLTSGSLQGLCQQLPSAGVFPPVQWALLASPPPWLVPWQPLVLWPQQGLQAC